MTRHPRAVLAALGAVVVLVGPTAPAAHAVEPGPATPVGDRRCGPAWALIGAAPLRVRGRVAATVELFRTPDGAPYPGFCVHVRVREPYRWNSNLVSMRLVVATPLGGGGTTGVKQSVPILNPVGDMGSFFGAGTTAELRVELKVRAVVRDGRARAVPTLVRRAALTGVLP